MKFKSNPEFFRILIPYLILSCLLEYPLSTRAQMNPPSINLKSQTKAYFVNSRFNIGTGMGGIHSNTALGYLVLNSNITGQFNSGGGFESLASNTVGNYNTSWGYYTLRNNVDGYGNSAFGAQSLFKNSSGYYNLAGGVEALKENTTGYQNTALGGYDALHWNTTGANNTALGSYSMYHNTIGNSNTGIGQSALFKNTSGFALVAVGLSAGEDNLTGNFNTYVGYMTGKGIKTGNNNTIIGSRISGLDENMSNHIIIADGEGNQRIRVDSIGIVSITNLAGEGKRPIFVDKNGSFTSDVEATTNVSRVAVDDEDYKVTTEDYFIAIISMTENRSIMLPASASINQVFIIKDEIGIARKYPITITAEEKKKIDGKLSKALKTNYGVVRLYFNGTNYFTM